MTRQQDPREALPRAIEGGLALTSGSRGRGAAPRFSIWLPIVAKGAAATIGALILAVIGAKAGAHGPPPAFEPAPSATPPALAAGFMVGSSSTATTTDAGAAEPVVAAPADPVPPGAGLLADGRVVLNAATETELTKLPGIGPSRARAILTLRQRMTKFRAVEDLLRIKGIGRKMLRRLRPNVVLDRPTQDGHAGHDPPAVAPPTVEDSDRTN